MLFVCAHALCVYLGGGHFYIYLKFQMANIYSGYETQMGGFGIGIQLQMQMQILKYVVYISAVSLKA